MRWNDHCFCLGFRKSILYFFFTWRGTFSVRIKVHWCWNQIKWWFTEVVLGFRGSSFREIPSLRYPLFHLEQFLPSFFVWLSIPPDCDWLKSVSLLADGLHSGSSVWRSYFQWKVVANVPSLLIVPVQKKSLFCFSWKLECGGILQTSDCHCGSLERRKLPFSSHLNVSRWSQLCLPRYYQETLLSSWT